MKSAVSVREQLVRIMSRLQIKPCSSRFNTREYYINIRKAMLAGYFMQVAHLEFTGRCYLTINDGSNKEAHLHPSSCLDDKPEWVIYNEYVYTSQDFIRTVTRIREEWLVDVAPHYYNPASSEVKGDLPWHYKKRKL